MFSRSYKYILSAALVLSFDGCDKKENTDIKETKTVAPIEKSVDKNTTIKKKEPIKEELKEKKVVKKEVVYKPAKEIVDKKTNFKNILVPIITSVYIQLDTQYNDIKRDIESSKNRAYIETLKKRYKVKTDQELLEAIKPHPISIVLAQAAAESAWLTSRFTKSANNIFGVWSFNKNEPRIPAIGLRADKVIYLKKYKTLKIAVEDYYFSIAKSWAYKEFRKLRVETNDPYKLIPHLGNYSEKREKYTTMLSKIVKYNKFDQYDIK